MQSCTEAEKRVKRSEGKGESSGRARRKGDKQTADEGSEWARLFDADWLLAGLAFLQGGLGCRRASSCISMAPDALQHWMKRRPAMRRCRGMERLLARSCADRCAVCSAFTFAFTATFTAGLRQDRKPPKGKAAATAQEISSGHVSVDTPGFAVSLVTRSTSGHVDWASRVQQLHLVSLVLLCWQTPIETMCAHYSSTRPFRTPQDALHHVDGVYRPTSSIRS